ncbi:MAG: RNA polymerase sigma factor, partial [Phycisphaerae bacterium]
MEESVGQAEGDVAPGEGDGSRAERAGSSATATPVLTKSVRDRLVRLAYRFLWNVDDAEDAVHEALAAAQERAGALRDREKWWSWVCRIVVHRCHEHGRRKLRRERHAEGIRAAALQRGEGSTVAISEGAERVRRLVLKLPRRQREVIVLRHLHGMDYEQIAAVLEISRSTARVHAQAGREALKELLMERHPDWFDGKRR